MAADLGISLEEALRRLQLQDAIGELGARLERQEAETFAGLWIQHEPEYRVVVVFTRDSEDTIRPYVENTPLADLIEVRNGEATYDELVTAQQQAQRQVARLGLPISSGINVFENQVELYVTDRALFDSAMQAAHIQLPPYVVVISVYEPLGTPPFPLAPVPDVHFPQLKARSSTYMTALLEGRLVVKNGCLRVTPGENEKGTLIIWQTDYFLNGRNGASPASPFQIEILDREGEVVAQVGKRIRMGGGEVSLNFVEELLREPMPEACEGPYWLMGGLAEED